jgi:hypothetical protein
MEKKAANGALKIVVCNCVNVPNLERFGMVDPFVSLDFKGKLLKKKRKNRLKWLVKITVFYCIQIISLQILNKNYLLTNKMISLIKFIIIREFEKQNSE